MSDEPEQQEEDAAKPEKPAKAPKPPKAEKPKKAKADKADKPKKGKGKKGAGADEKFRVSLTDSPRALASIRRTKARGGLLGFAIGALVTWMHGSLPVTALVHGLEGGIAGYLVCWFAAVTAWRHVIRAEVHSAVVQATEQRKARLAKRPAPLGARSE